MHHFTFTKWIFKVIHAIARTVSTIFITIFPIYTISTGSGTCTVVKSVYTFYRIRIML